MNRGNRSYLVLAASIAASAAPLGAVTNNVRIEGVGSATGFVPTSGVNATVPAVPRPVEVPNADALESCREKLDAQLPPPGQPGASGVPTDPPPAARWQSVDHKNLPAFEDGESKESLLQGIRTTKKFWESRGDQTIDINGQKITGKELGQGLDTIAGLLSASKTPAEFRKALESHFDVVQAMPNNPKPNPDARRGYADDQEKTTGYFSPSMEISRERTPDHTVPIYDKPADRAAGTPHRTRKEIADGALEAPGPNGRKKQEPIFWTKDPIELEFANVQGGFWGTLPQGQTFPNGSNKVLLSIADTNGYRWRSIITSLKKCFCPEGVAHKDCRVAGNPLANGKDLKAFASQYKTVEDRQKLANLDLSYVFYKVGNSAAGPTGTKNIPLTPGRSIATDPRYFPTGGYGLLVTDPVRDARGRVVIKGFSHMVFAHDVGGAIKYGGRVDRYFGLGDEASASADMMNAAGRLYMFLPKRASN
ncbi:MAG: MltA domain-containing protein [Elusimicrobia bacterium]|nr:MltA domain-containing protein [Elusimicrobiota bacterium]